MKPRLVPDVPRATRCRVSAVRLGAGGSGVITGGTHFATRMSRLGASDTVPAKFSAFSAGGTFRFLAKTLDGFRVEMPAGGEQGCGQSGAGGNFLSATNRSMAACSSAAFTWQVGG